MKSLAVLSALVSVAFAQSSSLIPSAISDECDTFLTALNKNTTLSACTAPLIAATSAYGPGGNASSAASSASVTSALNNLCSSTSSTSCSQSMIQSKLADFYAECSAELTANRNADVVRAYDTLYALTPLKQAVCAKDDSANGAYCVSQLSSVLSGSSASSKTLASGLGLATVQKYLWSSSSGSAQQAATVPNATTYAASNVAFLFLQPSLQSAQLCTSCTRSVLSAYIAFETAVPYAPGLPNSQLLSGQMPLYNAVTGTCGASFLSGAVQAAGSLKGGIGSSDASPAVARVGGAVVALGTIVLGAVAFF